MSAHFPVIKKGLLMCLMCAHTQKYGPEVLSPKKSQIPSFFKKERGIKEHSFFELAEMFGLILTEKTPNRRFSDPAT